MKRLSTRNFFRLQEVIYRNYYLDIFDESELQMGSILVARLIPS